MAKKHHKKKGLALGEFSGMALMFIVCAITIGIGATILTSIQASQCTGGSAGWTTAGCGTGGSAYNTSTLASNITTYGISGTSTMGSWLPCYQVNYI